MIHLLFLLPSARAATWTVNADGSGTAATLEAAIFRASDGDEIILGEGTFTVAADLGTKSLTVRGRGSELTILVGSSTSSATLSSSGTSSVEALSLQNPGGRAVYVNGGSLTLSEVLIDEPGDSTLDGSAILVQSGEAVLESSTIDGGSANYGMVYLYSGARLVATDSTFSSSYASYGAAIFSNGGTIELEGSTFDRLAADYAGGAIYLWGGQLSAVDTTFYGNLSGAGHGGAIYGGSTQVSLDGGTFELNSSSEYTSGYYGGAIYLQDSTLNAVETEFSENYTYYGGALFLARTETEFERVQMLDNWSYAAGGVYFQGPGAFIDKGSSWEGNWSYYGAGGLYAYYYYVLEVDSSVFLENFGYYSYGGGAYGYYLGSSTWTDVLFQDNYAYYSGGGLMLNTTYGTDRVEGCTFEGNEAQNGAGGALMANYYSTLQVVDSTFSLNQSYGDGGAISAVYSGVLVRGSTFTDNLSANGQGGALYSYYGPGNGESTVLTDNDFTGNEAHWHGGAIASYFDQLTLTDNRFHVNAAGASGMGGGVLVNQSSSLEAGRNRFSGNTASYGGGAYAYGPISGGGTWTNNQFIENTATIGGGLLLSESGGAQITNNAFLGNSGVESVGALGLVSSPVTVLNNLFAWSESGEAIYAFDEDSLQGAVFDHNAFYELGGGVTGGSLALARMGSGSLFDLDPLLSSYRSGASIDSQILVPLRDSPLIDAGSSTLLDPDGGPSDIGAWGGPGIVVEDADADGWDNWLDCDDAELLAFPGGADTWYDGINGDCLSGSDYDADGDGYDVYPYGADCDDADASIWEGCDDTTTGDGGSSDGGTPDGGTEDGGAGDGGQDRPKLDGGVAGGCSCATGGSPGAWALVLLIPALVRRRRLSP